MALIFSDDVDVPNISNENSDMNVGEFDQENIEKVENTESYDADKSSAENQTSEVDIQLVEKTEQEVLTSDQIKASKDLNLSLSSFLKNNFKIEENTFSKKTISTGIDVLDAVLGGGVGMGFVQFVGPPGSGKSALVSKIIATGQRKYPGKFIAIYADSEVSMSTDRLAQLGVKYPKLRPYTDITVEKVFKFVEAMCSFKENNPQYLDYPSVIVWDSLANTLTEKGIDTEDPNAVLGEKARILSFLLPKYVPKLERYNISLLAINQLRDKIDMGYFKKPNELKYMGEKVLPGGESTKFNSFQLFFLRPTTDLKGEYGFSGTKVVGKCVKNKLFAPNIEISMVFSFKNGFSNFFTNYELLKETKRVKAGAWCSLISMPEIKFRQIELAKIYKTNPKFKEIFDQEVKDAIKAEFIDKYSTKEPDDDL